MASSAPDRPQQQQCHQQPRRQPQQQLYVSPENPKRIVMSRALTEEELPSLGNPSKAQEEEDKFVASSCSLVGEIVVDSPTGRSKHIVDIAAPSASTEPVAELPNSVPSRRPMDVSLSRRSNSGPTSNEAISPKSATAATPSTTTRTSTAGAPDTALDSSAGIVAAGLAWVQRNRDRRRRLYLQAQAERQLQKIAEAERQQAVANAVPSASSYTMSSMLSENSTFRQLMGFGPVSSGHDASTRSAASSLSASEKSATDETDSGIKVASAPQLSKSGEGASGRIDVTGPGYVTDEELLTTPRVRVESEDDEAPPYILNADQMHQVASCVLPSTVSYCRWKRIYSLTRDGDSFEAFLRVMDEVQRTLMVVRTTRGEIFGGYAGAPWKAHDQKNTQYYGSADSSLYKFAAKPGNSDDKELRVYKWTGANRYIQICDTSHKMIAFGGGGADGSFGLCIEEDFQFGSTGPCDTFNNEPLCEQESFSVMEFEVFTFLTGVF